MVSVNFFTNSFPGIVAFIGGFILFFGLFSFVVKERAFLSDSLVATILGIIFGPLAIRLVDPYQWPGTLNSTTLNFSDLVINIQIMAAAIALPRKFWKKRWRALAVLLGPVSIWMWLITALFMWLVLRLDWLDCLILAACTTPTDPVLANSIVNGRFADLHIHLRLRQLLSGESAANDGIALPFFYLGVYLIKYSAGEAIKNWFLNVVLYEMCVAIAFGCSVGYAMRYALRFSEERNYIDKKNFLVFEIAFACFVSGIASTFGISSFISTFVAGLVFSWDGWFTKDTEEAHVQEVIDMLVNIVFFIYFGASIPWSSFNVDTLPTWKLIVTSLLVLLVRRLPIVIGLSRSMKMILTWQEIFFVGWFGPVGVGALWYMALAIKIFPQKEALFFPIIYFIVFVSVIIHGIMVPIVHLTLIGIRIRTASIEEERGAPEWPENVPFSRTMISNPIIDGNTGLPVPAPMAMIREASHEGVARIDRGESELNMIVTSQDALLGSN